MVLAHTLLPCQGASMDSGIASVRGAGTHAPLRIGGLVLREELRIL